MFVFIFLFTYPFLNNNKWTPLVKIFFDLNKFFKKVKNWKDLFFSLTVIMVPRNTFLEPYNWLCDPSRALMTVCKFVVIFS